jgi:polyphosphate kinase
VANKSLNFIVKLGGRDAFGRDNSIAIVKVPRVLPRVIRLPAKVSARPAGLRAAEQRGPLAPAGAVPRPRGGAFSQFRVTRDSDLDVDEEDVATCAHALRQGLSTRHYGQRRAARGGRPVARGAVGLSAGAVQPADAALYRVQRAGQPGAPERS